MNLLYHDRWKEVSDGVFLYDGSMPSRAHLQKILKNNFLKIIFLKNKHSKKEEGGAIVGASLSRLGARIEQGCSMFQTDPARVKASASR